MSVQNQQRDTVPIRQLSPEQVRRYFIPVLSPGKTIAIGIAVTIGVLISLLGIALSNMPYASAGIVLCLICIFLFVWMRKLAPSDQEYDAWLKGQVTQIRRTALRELQIEKNDISGPPLLIRSFTLPGSSIANGQPENTVLMKKGRDGQYRFSINFYTYLFPCYRYIAVYTQCVNAVAMSSRSYQNDDYPSQHIVRPVVLHSEEDVLIEGEWRRCDIEQVGLGIANQEIVPLGAHLAITPIDSNDGPTIALPGSNVQQTVMNVRKLLRRN